MNVWSIAIRRLSRFQRKSGSPPVLSAPRDPPGQALERIAIRKIGAPVAGNLSFTRTSWLVRPGETFAAGSTLGEVTVALLDEDHILPVLLFWFVSGVVFLVTLGWKRLLLPCPVIAPEDGVLTWHVPKDSNFRVGEPIAAYIPLAAWQEYVQLLTEHDQQFRTRSARRKQAAAIAVSDSFSGKIDAMIARLNDISARAIRDDKTAMLPLLLRQIRSTIHAACSVESTDIAPIYHRYFSLIQSIDERLLAIDARYAALRSDPALSQAAADELVRSWLESKETVIRQVTGWEEDGAR